MHKIIKFIQHSKVVQLILLSILILVLVAVLLDYPISRIDQLMPNYTDVYFISWDWSWTLHALSSESVSFFDANIFAPHKNTLAFSEHMLGTAIFAWPIMVIFNNITLAYNIVVLLSFIISAIGMYLLVLYLTRNKWAALVAAIFYSLAPFKLIHSMAHLHVNGMWLPFVFLYLHKFFNLQSWKNTLLLTFFIVLVFLHSMHYFIFLPIIILIYVTVFMALKKFKFNKDNIKKIVTAFLALLIFAIPLIIPYFQIRQEFKQVRPIWLIEGLSPDIFSYFIFPFMYGPLAIESTQQETLVGPGLVILALFFVLLYLFRRYKYLTHQNPNSKNIFIYVLVASVSVLISFGYYIQLTSYDPGGLIGPYALFYHFIPGFDGIRAVGRYSIFALLSLCVLIGYGLPILLKRFSNYKKLFIILVILSIFIYEMSFVINGRFININLTQDQKQLYAWVAQQSDNNIFLEIPAGVDAKVMVNYDLGNIFFSRLHYKKLVNGYSGYFPPGYENLTAQLRRFKPQRDIHLIKQHQVDYLLVHFTYYLYSGTRKDFILSEIDKLDSINYVSNFGEHYIFKINYD